MSDPITIKERRAVEWREQEVSYTYEELLELFGDDDCSAVRPLVLRCMALEQERATFYEDYRRKFDVETKALHVEIARLQVELSGQRDGEWQEIVTLRNQLTNALNSLKYEHDQRLQIERAYALADTVLREIDDWFRQEGAFPDYIQARIDAALGGRDA